jgi:outer membrane PBP1 activator LpoA protein
MANNKQRCLCLLIALTLAGCVGPSPKNHDAPLIAEADGRFRKGDFTGASMIYQRLAEKSDDADYYRLLAADSELRAGNDRAAYVLLGTINESDLEEGDRARYALLRSRIDLNLGWAKEAMARLDGINYDKLTTPLRAHYHTLRASGYNQLGNMVESAKERVYYAQYTSNPEALQKNNEAIYDTLNHLPYKQLTDLQPKTQGTLGGWMALVIALRAPQVQRGQAVANWQTSYPSHPANGNFLDSFNIAKPKNVEVTPLRTVESARETTPVITPVPAAVAVETPTQPAAEEAPSGEKFVGVMLPLTGTYAPAAQAVRTGLMAAAAADNNIEKLELRFVDTQKADVGSTYRKLVAEGAKFVIGPLTKDEVAALGGIGDLPIPVLALNQLAELNRDKLYQFALTPEQELEQVASLAWFDGRQNALVLAPSSALGQRLSSHFNSYWKSLGGKIANTRTYQPGAADYSDTARQLLANISGTDPAVAAQRPEFIFLIADSRDGSLLNPHIQNQQPSRIPLYATSMIYNGQQNSPKNQDLVGVTFCDSPWLLDSDSGPLSLQALQPAAQKTPELYLRLLPMGIDAYALISQLDQLKAGGLNRYGGASGVLTMRNNRIQRQLHCAQFDGNSLLQPRGIAPTLQPSSVPPR